MSQTFKFGDGHELRTATAADLDQARAWTEADPHHRGVIAPEFWIENSPGVETYVLSDASGDLFFFRIERVARTLIQFAPDPEGRNRERVKSALKIGMDFLATALGTRGYGELLFDSFDNLLRMFALGRLRFTAKAGTLSRRLQIFIPRPKETPADLSGPPSTAEGATPHQGAIPDRLQGVR